MIRLQVGHGSDMGSYAESEGDLNEDSYYCDDASGIFIIADGLGGPGQGQIASNIAVKQAGKRLEDIVKDSSNNHDSNFIENELKKICKEVHDHILKKSEAIKLFKGMGTTIDIALLNKGFLYIAHIGDSRIGIIKEGFEIITPTKEGLLDRIDKNSPVDTDFIHFYFTNKNNLNNYLGRKKGLEVHTDKLPLDGIKSIILYTDGLSNISNKTIAEVLLEKPPQLAVNQLIDLANNEPNPQVVEIYSKYKEISLEESKDMLAGDDNITAIVIKPTYESENLEAKPKIEPKILEILFDGIETISQRKEREVFEKGMKEFAAKDYDSSFHYFQEAYKENPNNLLALRYVANSLGESGDLDRAAGIYEKILQSNPNDKNTLNALGGIHISNENKSKAIDFWRQAAEKGSRFAIYNLHHFEEYCNSELSQDQRKELDKIRARFKENQDREFIRLIEKAEQLISEYPCSIYRTPSLENTKHILEFQQKLHRYISQKKITSEISDSVKSVDERIEIIRSDVKGVIQDFTCRINAIQKLGYSFSAGESRIIAPKKHHYLNLTELLEL